MRTNTDGLILKEQNIGEKDKLVTVLTRHNGLVRAFVRGAKSVNNRKNSSTGMFCFSKLCLYKTKESYIIDEAEPIELFFELRNDLEKLSLAQYFGELVITLVQEDEPAEEYLRLILNSLHFLAKGKMPVEQVKAITELRLMCIAGYMPNLVACDRCGEYETNTMYFDVEDGLLYCENCMSNSMLFPLDIGLVKALRHIAFSDFEKIYSFKMEEQALPDLSYITEKYLLSKLQRNFKTLEFYKEITK
ncbi:MAG: DNA repair protein RecO [Clostridia bacterium]|nr:DNA repair protein RecO [Clostridia bacterium]